MVEADGAGARMMERPTNVYLTRAQREYVERRAAADTATLRAESPVAHSRARVTVSDIMRLALDRLIAAEPLEGEA